MRRRQSQTAAFTLQNLRRRAPRRPRRGEAGAHLLEPRIIRRAGEAQRLHAEVERLRRELDALETERRALAGSVEDMRGSLSWRVTGVFRWVVAIALWMGTVLMRVARAPARWRQRQPQGIPGNLFRYSIEWLEQGPSGTAVEGWAFHNKADLRSIELVSPTETAMLRHALARNDVRQRHKSARAYRSGFAGAMGPTQGRLELQFTFADGTSHRVRLPRARDPVQRVVRSALNILLDRSKRRQFATRIARGRLHELLGALHGPVPAPLVAKPIKPLAQVHEPGGLLHQMGTQASLWIIDHAGGGGANSYRDQLVDERAASTESIVVVTPRVPLTARGRFQVTLRRGAESEQFWTQSWTEVEQLARHCPPSEIFCNSVVGFADPLALLADVARLRADSDVRLTFAFHDYHSICSSYNLLDRNENFCGVPSIKSCNSCLASNPFVEPASPPPQQVWRKGWSDFLAACDKILFFSASSLRLARRAYHVPKRKIVLRPHRDVVTFARRPRLDAARAPCIGVIGNIAYHKGSRILVRTAQSLLKRSPNARIVVFGRLHEAKVPKNVHVTGVFRHEDLPALIEEHGVNIGFLPSVFPETFSYVTSELMALELPVACFNLGAQAERIRKYPKGLVLAASEPDRIARDLVAFHRIMRAKARTA